MPIIASDADDLAQLLKVDSNRNLYVSIMGGFFTPCTEYNTGADCSGSDGAANRVLTLSNATTTSQEMVTVDKFVLEKDVDYTVSHNAASSTITFLGKIWDTQRIVVRYFI